MTTRLVTSISVTEKRLGVFMDYLSLTKPRLSSLVIFTCALGAFLADTNYGGWNTLITVIATSGLVGGACAINCYMERDIDALMERTKTRPLPSGRIAADSAFKFGLGLILLCLSILLLFVNPLTAALGLIATLVYVFLYTPMKKKSSLALFAGAIPGAIPPLMGWTSSTNQISELGLALFGILFIWQLPHFLSISLYHSKDYNNADLKILPTQIGIRPTVNRIIFYTLALFLVSLVPYYLGVESCGYRNFIIFIGSSYLAFTFIGLRWTKIEPGLLSWARAYFYGSLIYLPAVFLGMIIFKL